MSKIQRSTTARHLSRVPWVQGGLWKGRREQPAQDPFKCQSMSRPLQSCHYSDHMGISIWPTWPPPGLPAPRESWLCHLQILVQDLTRPKPQFSQLYNGEDSIYCPGLFWRLRGNACEVLSTVPGLQWAPVPLSLFPLNLLVPLTLPDSQLIPSPRAWWCWFSNYVSFYRYTFIQPHSSRVNSWQPEVALKKKKINIQNRGTKKSQRGLII